MVYRFFNPLPILILAIVTTLPAAAQRLVIAGIDTSGFPTIRAKIYPLDPSGRAIEVPVPTVARCPGASSTASAAVRSAPASPGWE